MKTGDVKNIKMLILKSSHYRLSYESIVRFSISILENCLTSLTTIRQLHKNVWECVHRDWQFWFLGELNWVVWAGLMSLEQICYKIFKTWNDHQNSLFAFLIFWRPVTFLDNKLTVTSLAIVIIMSTPAINYIDK